MTLLTASPHPQHPATTDQHAVSSYRAVYLPQLARKQRTVSKFCFCCIDKASAALEGMTPYWARSEYGEGNRAHMFAARVSLMPGIICSCLHQASAMALPSV